MMKTNKYNKKNKRTSVCLTDQGISKKLQEHLYEMCLRTLNSGGYPISAHYFSKLVDMENELSMTNIKFKKRIRDNYCLLMSIVDNIKAAEDAGRTPGNEELIIRLLTQTIYMIQAQDTEYNWLLRQIYKIILKLSKHFDEEIVAEALSRVRYEYGCLLAENDQFLLKAIDLMETSLEKCKGTAWYTNDQDRNFLYEDVCTKLCETLLRAGEVNSKTDPEVSVDFVKRAANVIYQLGTRRSPSLYGFARIRQSEYLAALNKINESLENLKDVEKYIMTNDDARNKCEYYFWIGCCYYRSIPQDLTKATRKFKLSLNLSDEHDLTKLKAENLLYLGKIFSGNQGQHVEGRKCLKEARDIFFNLKEYDNGKLAGFLMAQLRAIEIFPNYIEMIRRSTSMSYCYMFDLMQWQQRLVPFWNEKGELNSHGNDYQCVMEERLLEHDVELG